MKDASARQILHIDDDRIITGIARQILVNSGFDVTSANHGNEVPDADWAKYDLIILDWMLPGYNGLQLFDIAKSNGFRGAALLLTARDPSGSERLLLSERKIHYMRKPFGPSSLLATVTGILAES